MDLTLASALSQLHHAAGSPVTQPRTPERRAALRTAWIVGIVAMVIYVGFYFLVGTAG